MHKCVIQLGLTKSLPLSTWLHQLPGQDAKSHRPAHALLVADPQILDMNSYPSRHFVIQWLSQVVVDLNMRKSWFFTQQLNPDVIVFLGDMMDRGREDMSTKE
jgi:hypothetical protein